MVVLDSWALLAYLKDEPAAGRIEAEWLDEGAAISSINLGEVLYIRIRAGGAESAQADVETIRRRLTVIDPGLADGRGGGVDQGRGGLSYADAFCIATALRLGAPLWTGTQRSSTRRGEHSCEVVDLRDSGS